MKIFRHERSWAWGQQRMVSLGTYLGRPMVQVNTEGVGGRILKSNLMAMYILYVGQFLLLYSQIWSHRFLCTDLRIQLEWSGWLT